MDRLLFWSGILNGSPGDVLCMRLELHPDMRLPPSEVERLSLRDVIRRHAILDQIDEAKANAAKK